MSQDWWEITTKSFDYFCEHAHQSKTEDGQILDRKIKMEMARIVLIADEINYSYLLQNGHSAVEYLAKHDDEFWLEAHDLWDSDLTEDDVKENINFIYNENGLSKERAQKLLEVWKNAWSPKKRLDAFK